MTLGRDMLGRVRTRTRNQGTESATRKQWRWLLPVLMLAPLGLGAKGCDAAVVGDDCPPDSVDPKCTVETPVDEACGGLLGKGCAQDEYCKYELGAMCGAADQTGVCAPIPDACDTVLKPVCACDGVTYENECVAALKGVSVSSLGRCAGDPPPPPPPPDKSCGGIAGIQCERGSFCNFPPDTKCGAADQTGVCTAIPTGCREIYSPVCGCDGKTYGNECEAASAGVSIISSGKCAEDPPPPPPDGEACGGIAGLACDKGEYCNFPVEAKCGAADQTGVCTAVPQACDANYLPVCGCDGKTYSNACEAAVAGISVQFEGECKTVEPPPPTGTVCGGLRGLACEKDQYCNYPPEANCGRADATGVCAAIKVGCTKESNPVCGCDGITYGNPCMAAAAGVSVEYSGSCKTDPSGGVCGGLLGLECEKGEFCDYSIEAQCGAGDVQGTCRLVPEACTEELAPVCGCDSKTYSNRCHAAAAGVSVVSTGACPKQ